MPRLVVAIVVCLFIASFTTLVGAQGVDFVRERYEKREHQIPMRDGAKLHTAVYSPKDKSQKYPILMIRTQSGTLPYGEDQYPASVGPSVHFARSGYIFVVQDVRGRYMSEGEFVVLRPHMAKKETPQEVDESTDTFDTIAWLVKNVENNNGRVGHYGTSYRGWLAAAGMIDAHPALKAVSPQAPVGDTFVGDDWHHNGALFLSHAVFYMPIMGKRRAELTKTPPVRPDYGTPDGYDFFLKLGPIANVNKRHFKNEVYYWNEVVAHPTYDDYWKAKRLAPHLKNIKPAVLIVAGWFDAEDLYGTLLTYDAVEKQNKGIENTLVMGPWIHGGWNSGDGARLGPVEFGGPTAEYYREKIEFPFFEYHLKGTKNPKLPEAMMFETGTNVWREYAEWPPKDVKPFELLFKPDGRLEVVTDGRREPDFAESDAGVDEFVSDPAKPVPYTDKITFRLSPEFMAGDQRFASSRPDVLVYESPVLRQPLTIVGPLTADLTVATSGTDADWLVKLIDVYPATAKDPEPNPAGVRMGGYQQLVRGEVMRGKFRESLEKPKAFKPDLPTPVKFMLPDVNHTFLAGHKIMVQVQSSWFPLVDRNPQTFVDIYTATEADFKPAVHKLYRPSSRITGAMLPPSKPVPVNAR